MNKTFQFIGINSLATQKDWIEKDFHHNSILHINLYLLASTKDERNVGLACQLKIKGAVIFPLHLI